MTKFPFQGFQKFLATRAFSGCRLLLFLLHCCHVLIMYQPNHVFDTQYAHLFKALDSVRYYKTFVNKLGNVVSRGKLLSGPSCSRSCRTASAPSAARRGWAASGSRRGGRRRPGCSSSSRRVRPVSQKLLFCFFSISAFLLYCEWDHIEIFSYGSAAHAL